jgi:hypothetical protein
VTRTVLLAAALLLGLGCSVAPGRAAGGGCADVDDLHTGPEPPPAVRVDASTPAVVVRFSHAAGAPEVREAIERVRGCVLGAEGGYWIVATDDPAAAEAALKRTPAVAYVERFARHRELRALTPWVPAEPPAGWLLPAESVAALLAPENLVHAHPRMNGPYPRDVLLVAFTPGSALAARREAVHRVGGTVVGGDRSHYYVRVRLECPDLPVWCAVDRLVSDAQVVFAAPLDMGYGPGG